MASRSNVAEENNNTSSRGIQKKVKNAELTALKRYKVDDYNNLLDFDTVLREVYCSFRPVSTDYETRKELLRNLNDMALDIYGNSRESSPVLEAYGSFVTDLFTLQSDLDVSISFGGGTSELPRGRKVEILKRFAKKLRFLEGQGHVRNVVSIFTARVPIVKFCDQGTAVECDLSVGNKDGILNSQIIRIISQIDGRFQFLCMMVKHWAKANDVNSALNRTLNSVSITLLVALHLQTQNPPILPPFSRLFKDGMDPANVEKTTRQYLNWGRRNQESLARLFVTFFIKLQSVEFLWRQGLCASVLNGCWISRKWEKAGAESISVEDFTDVSQNVARRVNGEGAKRMYSSVNRTVDDIFEFLNGKVSETYLRYRLFGQQAVVEPPSPLLPFNERTVGTDLRRRFFRQQAVVEPPSPVLPLNERIAGTDLRHRLFRQQAAVEPPPHVPPLNGNIAGTHLGHRLYGQPAVVEPPPGPPLSGNIAGTHLRHSLVGQQAIVEPSPVPPLSGNIAGAHLRHSLVGQQAVVDPPPVPTLNGNIAGTHLRHSLFGQQALVEAPPRIPPLNVYPQQPHNYRNGFNGLSEEHHNKRVGLGNGYRAVEGTTSHRREEERYENLRGKRNRYVGNSNGAEEYGEIQRFVKAVMENLPPASSLNVHPQEPHNSYRNGFNGPPEEHHNKRVCLGNGYRAVEGTTSHGREQERYEEIRGKIKRYGGNSHGFEEHCEIPRFGIHNNPLDDPHRQVPLNGHLVHNRHAGRFSGEEPMPVGLSQNYSRRIGPAPPQLPSPSDRVSFENPGPQNVPQPYFGRSFN